MFTGKNANQKDAWRKISLKMKKTPVLCRQQWQALIRKYKSLTQKKSGSGNGDEAPEGDVGPPESWPYFGILHEYASKKDNFYPSRTSCSIEGITDANMYIDSSDDEFDDVESPTPGPSNDFSRSTPLSSYSQSTTPVSSTNVSSRNSSRSRGKTSKTEDALLKESRKIGNKVSSALAIFGQIVQKQFPDIDVSSLLISESENWE